MEFEVSPGFTPHQHSAVRENQQVRVIRSWEGPVPPVTLPLQPGNPPMSVGGRATIPATSVPLRVAQPSPPEGSREGTEEPVVVPGHWDSWDDHPHLCNKSPGPQQLLRALLPWPIPNSQQEFCKSHSLPHLPRHQRREGGCWTCTRGYLSHLAEQRCAQRS